jgi:2'-5' RNA ligase
MPERKRTFIAVRFSAEVERGLVGVVEQLERRLRNKLKVKWVGNHQLHLTLQFLGDVDIGLFPKLAGGLKGAFRDMSPFEVVVTGVGAFPTQVKPRVIWAGFKTGADNLKTLQSLVLGVTEPLGFPREERPFSPHVTLGRVKEGGRPAPITDELASMLQAEVGRCQIDMVVLMTSDLRPEGPVYSTIDSFPLGQ